MTKYVLITVVLSIFVLLAGCENKEPKSAEAATNYPVSEKTPSDDKTAPKEIITKFVDALLHKHYVEAYKCISSYDKSYIGLEDVVRAESENKASPLQDFFVSKTSYHVKQVIIVENQAMICITTTSPNWDILLGHKYAAWEKYNCQDHMEEEAEKIAVDRCKKEKILMVTNTENRKLVKEKGEWKVDFIAYMTGIDDKTSSLKSNLHTLRGQFGLYKSQHDDLYPWDNPLTKGCDFESSDATVARLINRTDMEGNVTPNGVYGPYMDSVPRNPFVKNDTAVFSDTHGCKIDWTIDVTSGSITDGQFRNQENASNGSLWARTRLSWINTAGSENRP